MGHTAFIEGNNLKMSAKLIRANVHAGMPVKLKREPNNEYDHDAVAVYVKVNSFMGLFGESFKKLGYLHHQAAHYFSTRIDNGLLVTARVTTVLYPDEGDLRPRIKLEFNY